jgi:hypothetical protein
VLQQQQQHGASYEGQVPPQPHRREGEDQLMSKFVPSASIVHDFTFSFLVLDIVLFISVGCSLLRAEGCSCSLDVLYRGLGISKLQFLIKKMIETGSISETGSVFT